MEWIHGVAEVCGWRIAHGAAAGGSAAGAGGGLQPLLGPLPLVFALPTIVAGVLLSPYFDLTFHRAAQEAPSPRIAFATFGLTFAAMLLLVASFADVAGGASTYASKRRRAKLK